MFFSFLFFCGTLLLLSIIPATAITLMSKSLSITIFKTDSTTKKIKTFTKHTKESKNKTNISKAKIDSITEKKEIYSNQSSMFQITKEKDNWFFEIPDSLIGRLILAVTRYTTTPAGIGTYGGEEAKEQTVYFELSPDKDKIFLRSNILYNNVDTTDVISKAVRDASSDPIIGAFKVEKRLPKAYKIDVTSIMLQDNCFSIPQWDKTKLHISVMLPNSSYIERVHSYPINTEIRTIRTYTSTGGSISSLLTNTVTIGLNTSFLLLPKTPMRKRLFDPRVGYFTDSYYTFSDNQQRVSKTSFITRWRLEPKDCDIEKMKQGELVEPKKQIVYYIDPATPKKWRPYLIAGVKDWNKAFEKAGFKNAITAKEWPENDSTMSLEDARFAVIRYLASDIANAYGPQIHDPRSGEIIESHVGWYHNVMSLVHDWYMIQTANVDPRARKMKFDDELMGQLIRFVSSHEIGHTLGLRHNFGSSSTVPVEKLRDRNWVKVHGHTPSIMDYARFNYVAQPEDGMEESELFPRVNDYDCWAIEWGYKPIFNATDAESDRYELDKITTKKLATNLRLWWGDGEKGRPDPRCQTEDLGDDAVKASEYGIKNLQHMIGKLPEWTYWGNDVNNNNLSEIYNQLLNQFKRYCGHVRRNLNGYYFDQKTVNEPGAIYRETPREKETSVLPFFNKYLFTEPSWLIKLPYYSRISYTPSSLYITLADISVSPLVSASTLDNMNSNYPVQEFLPELQKMLFKELSSGKAVTTYRRILQRSFVDGLVKYFNQNKDHSASDGLACTLLVLKDLQKKIASASNRVSDNMTRAHYIQISDEISRALVIK